MELLQNILSGFLRAGEIALFNHILKTRACLKVADVVNDMSKVNVVEFRPGPSAWERQLDPLPSWISPLLLV